MNAIDILEDPWTESQAFSSPPLTKDNWRKYCYRDSNPWYRTVRATVRLNVVLMMIIIIQFCIKVIGNIQGPVRGEWE